MLSRIGHVLLSLVTRRFEGVISTTIVSVAQEFIKKGRQTLLLVMASFIFSILLTAGLIIFLLDASKQYDANGVIYFSALLSSSAAMVLVSLVVLIAIFWPRKSVPVVVMPPLTHTSAPSSIDEIIAVLINEGMQFFKDRGQEKSKTHAKEYSHT